MRQLAVMLATIAALATGSAAAGAATTKTVRIKDIDFSPKLVTIKRGDSVRWRFLDGDTPHNVTSRGKLRFRSSPTKQRGSYTVRFAKAGTYAYVCTLHINMKSKVVVS
jgi:plastocyanin